MNMNPGLKKASLLFWSLLLALSCRRKTKEQNGFDICSSPDTTFVQLKSFSLRPFWLLRILSHSFLGTCTGGGFVVIFFTSIMGLS